MITFTQRYAVAPTARSATEDSTPYEQSLWRQLVATVLDADVYSSDFEPTHPARAIDREREVEARGEQVLEHVHLEAASGRVVVTRLSGRERGCLSYEISDRHNGPELVVTACVAVAGVRPGSAAEQHIADWYRAEQHVLAGRIATGEGRVSAQLAAQR